MSHCRGGRKTIAGSDNATADTMAFEWQRLRTVISEGRSNGGWRGLGEIGAIPNIVQRESRERGAEADVWRSRW